MIIDVDCRTKTLKLEPIKSVLKQGEHYADTIYFKLPLVREGIRLDTLNWQLSGTTDRNTTTMTQGLETMVSGEHLMIEWKVSSSFTSIGTNCLLLTLWGVQGENVIVRFDGSSPIIVKEEFPKGTTPPSNSMFAEALQQMSEILNEAKNVLNDMGAETAHIKDALQNISDKQVIIEQYYTETKHELDGAIADWKTQADQMLVNMSAYLLDMLRTGEFVNNPVTGSLSTVQGAVNSLYSLHTGDALTDAEYEALGLTVAEYEAFGLTTLEYDTQGKIYLRSS